MEIALPLVALSGLYLINNQSKKQNSTNKYENFQSALPNTNIPDVNYPIPDPIRSSDTELTSSLINNNRIDSTGVYTDKYFDRNYDTYMRQSAPSSEYYSLSGKKVDASYFAHDNMVPYFGGSIRGKVGDYNSNESVLDNMNGSGSQTKSKTEQSPLFAPHDSLQWANGAPNLNDFYQSRVNPSMRMANVKPFEEQRVGPGLGLGYTTEGAGGFNAGMGMREQWLDKNVDELRTANKPKASGNMMYGHEGPAYSYNANISSADAIGRVEKNRVDTAFEWGHDRLFTTTGAEKGPTLHAIPIDRYVSRPETAVSYTGAAGANVNTPYVTGEYMPSTNIELGAVPIGVANANGRQYGNEGDYEMQAKMAYPNNRSENTQSDYYGIMGGAIGAVVAPLLDVLRPSRRENTIGTLRPYQNPKSTVPQSYMFDPKDVLAPTIRETTEVSKGHLYVNANQLGGAYKVTEHQAANTNRQTTDDFYYAGNASAGERARAPRPYDAEYRQRNNDTKAATIYGRLVPGNMDLLNSNVNMKGKEKAEYLKNERALAPSVPYQSPSVSNMGQLQGMGTTLNQNIQLDRNTSDILDALKGNPYNIQRQ
jgi:hypothetical protein